MLISVILYALAILLALTFHEYAHGRVAYWLGDDTAKRAGRLTLNPLPHLDPFGTLMLVLSLTAGMGLGWAKPVPVNPMNFHGDRKRGMLLVSLAGPLSNLLLAFLAVLIYFAGGYKAGFTEAFLGIMIRLNVGLAIFNLLPVPPLDGSKILAGLLPWRYAGYIYQIERYGMIALLLIVFVFPGFLGTVLGPVIRGVINLLTWLAQLIF